MVLSPGYIVGRMYLKGCPKCRGDVEIRKDEYGWYLVCVQCGLCNDLKAPDEAFSCKSVLCREDRTPVKTKDAYARKDL